jgi:predicted nucleic-acid-binding protein
MRIIADANLLVRAITGDDEVQSPLAQAELAEAELVALPLVALSELVWTLSRAYKLDRRRIAEALRALVDSDTAVVDRGAVEAGLAFLEAGGDFADGVIAHQGRMLGGDVFVSFDQQAVSLVTARNGRARLVS